MSGGRRLESYQKSIYLDMVFLLWEEGIDSANKEHPDISVEEFKTANKYYDSKRCEGCYCGSCVGLSELSSNLSESPKELKPLADYALRVGRQQFNAANKK